MKCTLVIGNGFDLDVGMLSSYANFAGSCYWPFKHSTKVQGFDTLGSYLNSKSRLNTWFDVEEAIYEYAKQGMGNALLNGFNFGHNDKLEFEQLKTSLMSYLSSQEKTFVANHQSMGIAVLNALLTSKNEIRIYSFNYTNLKIIADKYQLKDNVVYHHIHGSTNEHNIILGIGDKREINPHYFYLYKMAASNFSSHHILPDLLDSDEVIIFGLSLGNNDFPYFAPFFQRQLSLAGETKNRKRITFFTRDENGRVDIKKRLQEMTDNQVTLLYSLNDVNIFCTDGSMNDKIEKYLCSINSNWLR